MLPVALAVALAVALGACGTSPGDGPIATDDVTYDGDAAGDVAADVFADGGCAPGACPICGDGVCEPGEEGCRRDCPGECGDGHCGIGEDVASCAADCPAWCGDAICSPGEEGACPSDCATACGDGVCAPTENAINCGVDCPASCGDGACTHAETPDTCAVDCATATCGDGVCGPAESTATCAADCGSVCGDGTCNGAESSASCAVDCGSVCGDAACTGTETTASCPDDCGTRCGDGTCNGDETATSCAADCGSVCGDGLCGPGESPESCAADCESRCGDGVCQAEESVTSCPSDCPVTIITILDHFDDGSGGDAYSHTSRWENYDLEFHGEAVAQSAIYGFDFMADADPDPELAIGTPAVEIVRWPTRVAPGGDAVGNMIACIETMYGEGSRIFNMSFGWNSVEVPAFLAWLEDFADDAERRGDPIVVTIGSGNDPRNTSTFDVLPDAFGDRRFFPNYQATPEHPWFVQVSGIEDNLDAVRWCGYESTFSDRWAVDVEASIKLWDYSAAGAPYWWGGRVGTSFSAPIVAGVLGYLQASLRRDGLEVPMDQIRDFLLDDAITAPFTYGGSRYTFPVVEAHHGDAYTRWDDVRAYALDESLGIRMQFDDVTDQFVYADDGVTPTREMMRRGLVAPANAAVILERRDAVFLSGTP